MYFKLLLSYSGIMYGGAAKQPDCTTIQGLIELCIDKVIGSSSPVTTKLISRTDKHVNAYEQILIVKSKVDIIGLGDRIKRVVFNMSEGNILIHSILPCEGFMERNRSKIYLYKIAVDKNGGLKNSHAMFPKLCRENYTDLLKLLGLLSNKAFDYSPLCKKLKANKRPVIQLLNIEVEEVIIDRKFLTLNVYIKGSCFMYKQIRLIIGTLIHLVGKGVLSVDTTVLEKYKTLADGKYLYLHTMF